MWTRLRGRRVYLKDRCPQRNHHGKEHTKGKEQPGKECSIPTGRNQRPTVEEHQVMGGAGSAVCEELARLKAHNRVLLLGLPDRFVDHGDAAKLLASVGLDAAGILNSVRNAMSD